MRPLPFALALLLAACGGGSGHAPPGDPLQYGGDRPVTLQIPAAVEPGKTYPLVLVLHGYGASASLQQWYLQVSTATLAGGAFVLAPQGLTDGFGKPFWNASPICCAFTGVPPDDVAYLGGLLDAVVADWPVDPSRVVVFGHSNGAFMAYRLACDRADRVTAIAGLAGSTPSIDGSGCEPVRPVSVLHLHGTADGSVLYAGGAFPGGPYAGAEASTSQWAVHDGCRATWTAGDALDLEQNLAGAETTTATADGCPTGIDVARWTITGGGHIPAFAPGLGERVLGWLAAHPRPSRQDFLLAVQKHVAANPGKTGAELAASFDRKPFPAVTDLGTFLPWAGFFDLAAGRMPQVPRR